MKKTLIMAWLGLLATATFAEKNNIDQLVLYDSIIIYKNFPKGTPAEPLRMEAINGKLERNRGYIGLSLGPSFPIGKFSGSDGGYANMGLHLTLANFGILLYKRLGLAATWFGAVNPVDASGVDPWIYGGMSVGPLFSIPLSKGVECDVRTMTGPLFTYLKGYDDENDYLKPSVAFKLGTMIRFNVKDGVSFLLSADYFYTAIKDYNLSQKIKTIDVCVGVAYCFGTIPQ